MLTIEENRYYDNYNNMFASEGWKQLIDELSANRVHIADAKATKDIDDLRYRQGQLQVIDSILTLERLLDQAKEDAEASDE